MEDPSFEINPRGRRRSLSEIFSERLSFGGKEAEITPPLMNSDVSKAFVGYAQSLKPKLTQMKQQTSCGLNKFAAAAKAVGAVGNNLMNFVNERVSMDSNARSFNPSPNCDITEVIVKPTETLKAAHHGENVDIAVVADTNIQCGTEFDISAHVFNASGIDFYYSGVSMTYVFCFHSKGNSPDVCVTRTKTWYGSGDSVSFRLRAPSDAGVYEASMIVMQNTMKGQYALDRVDFKVSVSPRMTSCNWWDAAFSSILSKANVSASSPELTKKLSFLSQIFSCALPKNQEACQSEVLATLLVKLQHGTCNEQLIAAAALAEIACDNNARKLILETRIVESLSYFAMWGTGNTKAQARMALEKLAFGNLQVTNRICNALQFQFRLFESCFMFLLSLKGSGCISSKQCCAIIEVAHQTGTNYRSNNAGDGPEKTRDRKYWFPRFKSNWLGTYRSKQMFTCCECALENVNKRYKPADGNHCKCGMDAWKNAKAVEEQEYNSRVALSKHFGGLRYEEALVKARQSGMKRSSPSTPESSKRLKRDASSLSYRELVASQTVHPQPPASPLKVTVFPNRASFNSCSNISVQSPVQSPKNSPSSITSIPAITSSCMRAYVPSPIHLPTSVLQNHSIEPAVDLLVSTQKGFDDFLDVFTEKDNSAEQIELMKYEQEKSNFRELAFCDSFLHFDNQKQFENGIEELTPPNINMVKIESSLPDRKLDPLGCNDFTDILLECANSTFDDMVHTLLHEDSSLSTITESGF